MAYGVGVFRKQDIKDAVDRLRVINPNIKSPKFPVQSMRQLFNIFKQDVIEQYADDHNIPREHVNEKNIPSEYLKMARDSFAEALVLDKSRDFSDAGSIWLSAAESALSSFNRYETHIDYERAYDEHLRQKKEYADALSLIRDNNFQFQVGALIDKKLRSGITVGDVSYTAPSSKVSELNSSGDVEFGVTQMWEDAPDDARQALIEYANAIRRNGPDTEGISGLVSKEANRAAEELAKWYGIKHVHSNNVGVGSIGLEALDD